jgi:hypothetical protein
MSFISELQDVATELLKEFGAPCKVTRPDGTSVGSGFAVFDDDQETLDANQLTQTGLITRTLLVSPLPKDIEVGDRIKFVKLDYVVSEARVTRPTNATAYFTCRVHPDG